MRSMGGLGVLGRLMDKLSILLILNLTAESAPPKLPTRQGCRSWFFLPSHVSCTLEACNKMFRISINWTLVLGLCVLSGSSVSASDRYFFCKDGKAYYCSPPASFSEGCYIVRDNTNVVRVDSFPVVSTVRADEMIADCQPSVSQTLPPTTQSECCDGGTYDDCLPRLTRSCHCDLSCKPTKITGTQGELKITSKAKPFYDGIGMIDGTIPVPQMCATSEEEYLFRSKLLSYDCGKGAEVGCPEGCNPANCPHGRCEVRTCEVYEKKENCKVTCELCDREGKLIIAVRAGQKVADVIIGKVGKADFPEYPENMVVIRGRTEAEIRRLLKNPNIKFEEIVRNSSTTDLASQI